MENGTWELVLYLRLKIKTLWEVDVSSKSSERQTDQLKSLKHILWHLQTEGIDYNEVFSPAV
jgi:hypothetical protein